MASAKRLASTAGMAVIVAGLLAACSYGPPPGPTSGPPGTPSNISIAPPPMPAEDIPPPMPDQASYVQWDPGHWRWTGTDWVWVHGHYVERPTPAAVWIPGHWAQDSNANWVWENGHWQS